ncbi:uncharacterized protein PG986_010364 [Apiospora aurea]|uniref:Brl1/Brr6 domain-containing protein n=1 Tax=Apiospora aurea TaxID=335848 RepID=A0ABR1Q399_9PEZI
MERRTYESPMDWAYENNQGPMDPTSPFVRPLQNAQRTSEHPEAADAPALPLPSSSPLLTGQPTTDTAFGATRPGAFAANSTPNLSAPTQTNSPSKAQASSSSNHYNAPPAATPAFQRTATAPAWRNPSFTTPRKPFDMDPLSEVEDSPVATDADASFADDSNLYEPDTPEDNSRSLRHMSIAPARSKSLLHQATRRSPGKGEMATPRTMFGHNRDKIRKRKRRHDDKDISGYRLPYKHVNEWEESEDPDSDDSTYEPNEHPHGPRSQRVAGRAQAKKGWFASFLSTISKHPQAPQILGYWLTLAFNASVLGFALWILFNIYGAFRHEMSLISQDQTTSITDEIVACQRNFEQNRCFPRESRLPALAALCDEWEICMNQNPVQNYSVRFGARNMVEIANTIFESMHWKTMVGSVGFLVTSNILLTVNNLLQAAFFILTTILCTSGAALFKTSAPPSFTTAVPQHSQAATSQHSQQHHYYYPPRTPHRGGSSYALMNGQDETPDTDASPESMARPQLLPPPYETPGRRRSPSKEHRARSPTKSRSPSKKY